MKDAPHESWEEYRRRMLAETSRFIEWGLTHPDEVIEIPTKPANEGGFPAEVGRWFWGVVLTDRVTAGIQRWREFLRGRPKSILHGRRRGG